MIPLKEIVLLLVIFIQLFAGFKIEKDVSENKDEIKRSETRISPQMQRVQERIKAYGYVDTEYWYFDSAWHGISLTDYQNWAFYNHQEVRQLREIDDSICARVSYSNVYIYNNVELNFSASMSIRDGRIDTLIVTSKEYQNDHTGLSEVLNFLRKIAKRKIYTRYYEVDSFKVRLTYRVIMEEFDVGIE